MSGLVLGWLLGLSAAVALLAWVLGQVWARQVRDGLDRSASAVGQQMAAGLKQGMEESMERDGQITPAPMLDGVTLRDWLVHRHIGQRGDGGPAPVPEDWAGGVWSSVVAEFYSRAAADPEVRSYFHATDLDELQRHFTAQLVILTGSGVSSRLVSRLHAGHAQVRNEAGEPITGEIYDRVVRVLLAVLTDYGVPPAGLTALANTIWPLRSVIVKGL